MPNFPSRNDSVRDTVTFDKQPAKSNPTVEFVAGTLAGIVGLAVGFPLDTVKVRFQDPVTAIKYRGGSTFTAIMKITREEKLRGLYKGITSPLAGYAFLNGLIFSAYGFLMRLQLRHELDEPTIAQIGIAGAGSGIIASIITCPTDLIKIRQQAIITSQPSVQEITLRIFQTHGLRGLYRGITATALRDCGYGAYFATYEGTCRLLRPTPRPPHAHSSLALELNAELEQLSWPRLMFAGGVAGVIGWLATFGFDVVKTRIQATKRSPHNPYCSTLSTILHSYRAEGPRVFFVGIAPTLIRAIPVNMATFGAFELVKSLF
ncbi:carnitine/acyl carnitine carrier [Ramaria rubella]|nr:carnitine/acyl carnitine carrier [Ramaria rubella]